jgi:hypothetical protein
LWLYGAELKFADELKSAKKLSTGQPITKINRSISDEIYDNNVLIYEEPEEII